MNKKLKTIIKLLQEVQQDLNDPRCHLMGVENDIKLALRSASLSVYLAKNLLKMAD